MCLYQTANQMASQKTNVSVKQSVDRENSQIHPFIYKHLPPPKPSFVMPDILPVCTDAHHWIWQPRHPHRPLKPARPDVSGVGHAVGLLMMMHWMQSWTRCVDHLEEGYLYMWLEKNKTIAFIWKFTVACSTFMNSRHHHSSWKFLSPYHSYIWCIPLHWKKSLLFVLHVTLSSQSHISWLCVLIQWPLERNILRSLY